MRTLPVSVSGVVIACAIAAWQGAFKWAPAIICFMFAVLAQIVSNFANEYYDFRRGTDKVGRVGPRRGVTEGDIKPRTLLVVTYATLALACAIGLCALFYAPLWMLPCGIVIALAALAYSTGPFPLSYHGLGELTVFVFYGLAPVTLTYFVITGIFHPYAILASISVGFMGVNVLIVNNYRDVDDDREAGKRTAVVIFGRTLAALAYLVNGFCAIFILTPVWLRLWFSPMRPLWLIAPALYIILHIATWLRLRSSTGKALNPLLGKTARNLLLFTILFTISLLLK